MPSNEREVFEHLTADPNTEIYLDFISYAIFAHHKKHWIELFERTHGGQAPTQQDIDQWISNITNVQFDDMRDEGATLFDAASREYLDDEIEAQKKVAVEQSIITEIKGFTSPWRHLGIALLMAILAPILLGGVIFFFSVFDSSFPFHLTFTGKGQ